MRTLTVLLLTLLAGVAAAQPPAGGASAESPTAEVTARPDVEAIARRYRAWLSEEAPRLPREEQRAAVEAKAEELLAPLDIETLSVREVEAIGVVALQSIRHRTQAFERLTELADPVSTEGAIALVTKEAMRMAATRQRPGMPVLSPVLEHPGVPAALEEGSAAGVFSLLDAAERPVLQRLWPQVASLAERMPERMGPAAALAASRFVATLQRSGAADAAMLERVRSRVAAAMRGALPRTDDPELRERLALQIAVLDGAAARGELLGRPAPPVEFSWSSDEGLPGSLEGLRGSVVVLDFWATWCGPCIGAFPNIRRLQEHYAGEPVVVLGVTALQGRHLSRTGETIVTAGDPAAEHALMRDFIAEAGIAWPVVFTDEAAWAEFGVEGIPHMAIIGPDGAVRHSGLHPGSPNGPKIELIDALLPAARRGGDGG